MLYLSGDLAIMIVIAIACTFLTTLFCVLAGMPKEDGEYAVLSSLATGVTMCIGYAIMTCFLM